MRQPVVIDTNVAVVANGDASHAGCECVLACVRRLRAVRESETVLLDRSGLILKEYRSRLRPPMEPDAGHLFFLWLYHNSGREEFCLQVPITDDPERVFAEFPADPALEKFDTDDRKFVAVAIASKRRPPIVNASDRDWHEYREALCRNGIRVEFLCPELMSEDGAKEALGGRRRGKQVPPRRQTGV